MQPYDRPTSQRLAVLIDADNASPASVELLFDEIAAYGTAHVKRIYGDWTMQQASTWKSKLHKLAIQPIQQFRYTKGKNSTDSALIIDAMDLLYTGHFDGFCLVSSDSDFTRLAGRIREAGLSVYGFGEKKTPAPFVNACDKFIYTEILSSVSQPTGEADKAAHSAHQRLGDRAGTGDKNLAALLKKAYDAVSDDDGWANLGAFGAQLNKLSPAFDSRNYGYKKLGDLIRSLDQFEVRETLHGNNPGAKTVLIRLKE